MSEINFKPIRLSTDGLPDKNRETVIREFYGRIIQRVDISQIDGAPVTIDAYALPLAQIMVAEGDFGPTASERTPELLKDGIDDLVISVNSKPFSVGTPQTDTVMFAPGDVLVTSIGRQIQVRMPHDQNHMFTIQVPRKRLEAFAPLQDGKAVEKLSIMMPEVQFLFEYARLLSRTSFESAQLANAASDHLAQLSAIALGARRETDAIATTLASVWLSRIKNAVVNDLANPDLSVGSISLKLGISPRYVRKLFENEPVTLSDYINRSRCELALRRLKDPAFRQVKIADIAAGVGFYETTSFNRAFRRFFGVAPSDVRG